MISFRHRNHEFEKIFIIDLQLRLLQENLVGILKTLEQG